MQLFSYLRNFFNKLTHVIQSLKQTTRSLASLPTKIDELQQVIENKHTELMRMYQTIAIKDTKEHPSIASNIQNEVCKKMDSLFLTSQSHIDRELQGIYNSYESLVSIVNSHDEFLRKNTDRCSKKIDHMQKTIDLISLGLNESSHQKLAKYQDIHTCESSFKKIDQQMSAIMLSLQKHISYLQQEFQKQKQPKTLVVMDTRNIEKSMQDTGFMLSYDILREYIESGTSTQRSIYKMIAFCHNSYSSMNQGLIQRLEKAGFEICNVYGRSHVDNEIIDRSFEIVERFPCENFIILSGDKVFSGLLRHLRRHAIKTEIFYPHSTSLNQDLKLACDNMVYLDMSFHSSSGKPLVEKTDKFIDTTDSRSEATVCNV